MNALKIKNWSERQQVLAVILMAGLLIFGVSFALLLPVNASRRQLERRILDMRNQLAAKNYLVDESTLQNSLLAEQAIHQSLYAEWTGVVSRITVLPREQAAITSHVGHIDFKVAVLDASDRLRRKARTLGIRLPSEFGMDAVVRSTEDARQLMLQLRSLEKLVELLFDIRVNAFTRAEPLAPITHSMETTEDPFLEEYPVEIEFQGTLENVTDFFRNTLEPAHPFCVRRLRVDAAPAGSDLLTVKGVVSALVVLKNPEELKPEPQPRVRYNSPLGH